MHPYWIQKIEEARKESVTKFWVTIFIVIVVPILLVMKEDGYIILGIACFAAAGLRFYWTGKMEAAETQRRKEDEDRKKASLEPQMQQGMSPAFATAQWQATQTNPFPGPQFTNGVPTTPEFSTSGLGVRTSVDYSISRSGNNSPYETGVQTTPDFASSRGYASPAGNSLMPMQDTAMVPQGFMTGGVAPEQQIPVDYLPPAATQEQQPQTHHENFQHRPRPGRPAHFHDMAR